MTETDVYDMLSEAIWAVLWGAGPVMGVALVVGLAIALLQALTQVQEMTLTFVPKIVAIFVALLLSLPLIYGVLGGLAERIFDLIARGAP